MTAAMKNFIVGVALTAIGASGKAMLDVATLKEAKENIKNEVSQIREDLKVDIKDIKDDMRIIKEHLIKGD